MSELQIVNATITSGTTISAPVRLGTQSIVGFAMPSTWASGALVFRVSIDGGTTFLSLVDMSNTPVTVATPAAGTFIGVDPKVFAGVNIIELVCNSAPAVNSVIGVALRECAF